jgi:hypothetical protein
MHSVISAPECILAKSAFAFERKFFSFRMQSETRVIVSEHAAAHQIPGSTILLFVPDLDSLL